MEHRESSMSFGAHLDELRRRVFWSLIVPVPTSIILFFVAPTMREFICAPVYAAQHARGLPMSMQVMSPIETLSVDMKLALIGAFVIGAPWVLYQVWMFVSPGLYIHEKRFAHFLVPLSALLVAAGMALLYWVMLPLMMSGLIAFGESPPSPMATRDASSPTIVVPIVVEDPQSAVAGELWFNSAAHEIRVAIPSSNGSEGLEVVTVGVNRPGALHQAFRLRDYIDFVLLVAIAIAATFQLPVAILLLGWIGVVDVPMLRAKRKIAFFVIAVLSAVAGPGDLLSMGLLMVPLYALYEGSILLLLLAPAHRVAGGTIGRRMRDRAADGDSSSTT